MKLNFGFTDIFCPDEVPVRGRKASVSYVLLVCYVITKMLNKLLLWISVWVLKSMTYSDVLLEM